MKYFLWGAGPIGERLLAHLPNNDVIGFIDSDIEKIGKKICGKKVISPEEYFVNYRDILVIVSVLLPQGIIKNLKKNGVYHFLLCVDCPGEWMEENERTEFEEFIYNKISGISGKLAIYGLNLYSLYLCQKCYGIYGHNPNLIVEDSCDKTIELSLSKMFQEISFIDECDLKEWEYDHIICASKYESPFLLGKTVELFDCAGEIGAYWNEDLRKFKNIHCGERCFIIGAGPSIRIQDLNKLHNNHEISFGMNDEYLWFSNTQWRPSYYFCEDTVTLRESKTEIGSLNLPFIFLADVLGKQTDDYYRNKLMDRYYRFHVSRICYSGEKTKFSQEVSQTVYYGATITYTCLQFAAYMGFSKIYLLGVDFTGGRKGGSYGHAFTDKIEGKNFGEVTYYSYLTAKQYSEKKGFQIYNATRGGELEIFERIDFDELFMEYE